ncbi:MAG: L,D-transpeptidase [Acidimicrobiia bacterium]|nr:L,D-transpeptidase [Acidimicrobiia bacterium]
MERGSGRFGAGAAAIAFSAAALVAAAVVLVFHPFDPAAPRSVGTTSIPSGPTTGSGNEIAPPQPPAPTDRLVAEAVGEDLEVFDAPGATVPSRVLRRADEASGHLVLLVRTPPRDDGWLEVELAVRPNGSLGWVRSDDVSLATTPFRIEIRLGAHSLRVLEGDDVVVEAPLGIGAEAPPLPGDYFLRELLAPDEPFGDYGPLAYALSGYALSPTSVLGGDGRLALHGTSNPTDLLVDGGPGSLRVTNDVITYLARTVGPPLGTPVTIIP